MAAKRPTSYAMRFSTSPLCTCRTFRAYLRWALGEGATLDGPAEEPMSDDGGLETVSTGTEELTPGGEEVGRIELGTVDMDMDMDMDIVAAVGLGIGVLSCSGLDQGPVGSVAGDSAETLSN